MVSGETVLVTGVAAPWGRAVAARLLAKGDRRVIGVDRRPPVDPPPGLDVVIADIAHPRFVDLLRLERVATICHLAFRARRRPQETTFESNVMGTMRLAAAAGAAGVGRVVFRSSTAVYGARPDNAHYLTEDAPRRAKRQTGYLRDWCEIENFLAGFRHASGPEVTILRLANPVGQALLSPLARLLEQPIALTLLGFDPLFQVLAAEDAVDALVTAVDAPVSGTFNVAAAGPLPLSKLLALAGVPRLPLLHPLAYRGARRLQNHKEGRYLFPLPPDYLRYPCVADTGRIREAWRFSPRYDGPTAVGRLAATVV